MARIRIARRWIPDLLAAVALLILAGFWLYLSWGRLHDPIQDQGWYLQVAARVAAGQVLYRDVIWMYGPLPVYVLAALFRWVRTDVAMLFLVYYALAVVGCLLTYWVARFLLSPALAAGHTVLMGLVGGFSRTLATPPPCPNARTRLRDLPAIHQRREHVGDCGRILHRRCLATKPEFAALWARGDHPGRRRGGPGPRDQPRAAARWLRTCSWWIAALGYGVLARLATA
jgi:hypothetical protein